MKVNKINNDLEIKEGKGILLESSICLAWIELLILYCRKMEKYFLTCYARICSAKWCYITLLEI